MDSQAADWTFGDGGFVKVYGDRLAQSSILDAAVATRWVFFWMLSQADAEGRYRCATVAALARHANVTRAQARKAVRELEAPDPSSTSPEERGKRIVRIPGGWRVVNAAKYRAFRTERQEREAEKKRRQRANGGGHVPGRPRDTGDMSGDMSGDGNPDVRRETSDVRRETDTNGTEPVSSDSIPDERTELLAVCGRIAVKLNETVPAIVARVSAIAASNGHAAKEGFANPRAKGISIGWVRAALARARELAAELERPVPL